MKKINIILFTLVAIASIYSIFKFSGIINSNEVRSLWSYILQHPPIKWNNIYIDYKYGMHAVEHNDSLSIHYWGKEKEESVGVFIEDVASVDYLTTKSYNGTNFSFISGKMNEYYGHKIYIEEIMKNDNKRYMVIYHVIDLPVAIGYAGPQERLAAYKEVIDSILYLNKKVDN